MASSTSITLLKSHFLGTKGIPIRPHKLPLTIRKQGSRFYLKPSAKFDLFQILGGRGLCNGETGVQQELKRNLNEQSLLLQATQQQVEKEVESPIFEDGFEKEMMGLTGGFPGGEKGLNKFIEQNPPPTKQKGAVVGLASSKKPKPPELPLLMPGMIAIVKNPNNPFYMYCGIVQRITDGKAGVLFEGGNWDRLVTFGLDELQRREKGPPMKNPKSVILEDMLESKTE
uniref:Chlororespiratory reduction31 n=1 Tax=Melianthus villosus TaxID=377280 RepID=A0A0F7GZB6_9ROSI